ncbi:MAG: alpha/beta hydrolase, partial [Acidimicrobiia bacterium]|nr:alpha/beta hydrolase [Acidimicrobiia bacterium]
RRRPYPLAGVVRKRRRVFESRESARANFGRKAPFSCWDPIALDGYIEEGLVERHGQIELSCSPEFEAEVYDAASAHGLLELVSEVDVPAVVIVGDRSDTYSVEWGAAIARAFGRGELVVVGGGTHFIPMERPDVVAAEALSVLRSLASAQ